MSRKLQAVRVVCTKAQNTVLKLRSQRKMSGKVSPKKEAERNPDGEIIAGRVGGRIEIMEDSQIKIWRRRHYRNKRKM